VTTYALPAESDDAVWLADHPEHGGPLRFEPPEGARAWWNARHGIELPWAELLTLGEVDDEYPGEHDLHGTATPWYVEPDTRTTVRGADGAELFYVSGEDTVNAEDVELAKLIVELVNAHVAPVPAFIAAERAAAPDVSDKTRRWLREVIEDRPEGAYEGKYTAEDAHAAREVIRALFGRPAPAVEDDPLDSLAESQRAGAEGKLALAVNELVLYLRGLPTAALANLGRGWPELARHVNAVGAAHDALNR
jgi:hypothetical protein